MPQVVWIDNDGGGTAQRFDAPDGIALNDLFDQKKPGRDVNNYVLRMDGRDASGRDLLPIGGDVKISVTPRKMEGAFLFIAS